MPFLFDRARRCPWPLLLLVGCSGGGGSSDAQGETFDHATTRDFILDLKLTVDGVPAPGARIQIGDELRVDTNGELPESRVSGTLYFTGVTDQEGKILTELRLPEVVGQVALVAHVPGTSGPYSEPLLRSAWGPFAPSARIHVAADELGSIELALTTD